MQHRLVDAKPPLCGVQYVFIWWTVRESNSQCLVANQKLSHLTNSPYMVSDARIELAPHAPKARMIPFHQSEIKKTWCPTTESNCHHRITKPVYYHCTSRAK